MTANHIHDNIKKLCCNWHIVSLLVNIEKFDTYWSSLGKQELMVFETCPDITSYETFLVKVRGIISLTQINVIMDLEAIEFWFDTEQEIYPLVSCLLFGYFIQQILVENSDYADLGLQAIMVSLFKSGYFWIEHINLPLVSCLEIENWLGSFLNSIRDGQLLLLRKLDLYGVKTKLTIKEQLLLYIIETNAGIKTTTIAIKLGLSRATVKRMLNVLREKRLIEIKGINRATYYKTL